LSIRPWAIRWFVEEERHPHADKVLERILDQPESFAVPELFAFEVFSVLERRHPSGLQVFRKAVIPLLQGGLMRQPMTEGLAVEANRFVRLGLTGYDGCYAALARDLKGLWLTFDKKAHDFMASTINQIAEKFELDIIYAFGSHAEEVAEWLKGDKRNLSISPLSDVDIGVKPSAAKQLSVENKVNLTIALEDFFSANRVDLVITTEVDPFLAANIIRGERLFCGDEYEADEYNLYILRRAGDLVPLERERISLIMEKDQ